MRAAQVKKTGLPVTESVEHIRRGNRSMDPIRKIVLEEHTSGGVYIPRGAYVWLLADAVVEFRGKELELPSELLGDVPVPAPLDRLLQLDPCFGSARTGFKTFYQDDAEQFAILKCPHGNLFLEDLVTGVGCYSRLIFLGPELDREWRAEWDRFHRLSTDELHLMAVGKAL